MEQFQVRTDLALETREKFEEDNVEIKGVRVEEEYREKSEIKITTMVIETENGAKAMAEKGFRSNDILTFFYRSCEIRNVYDSGQ